MDKTSICYTDSVAVVSKGLETIVTAQPIEYKIPNLEFNTPDVANSCISKGSRRKWGMVDGSINLKDGSSLVLSLGQSSSSCSTIFSEKEMEEESSLDLGLSIDLFGNNQRIETKKASYVTAKTLQVREPKVDLGLSLSTGPAESDITTVVQGCNLPHNVAETPALVAMLQLVDEGSISSRWKCGSHVPPRQSSETTVHQVQGHNNGLPDTPNISTTTAGTSRNLFSTTGTVQLHQRRTNVKTCQFEGCTRGARGASGLCIAHGGGWRCQRTDCQKGAEGKTVFCKAHGGGRRCQHLGCTKSAEGRTDYCIGHGGGRRCSHDGCTRAARGKSGLCIRHGGGKRCKMENCTKSAEGISGLCISHGGGRRCLYPVCTKGAQGSTMFCKAHGGGKRCTYLGCTKGAEGSTPFCKGHGGGKRCTFEACTKSVHGGTLFCVSHGGGKRCAISGCTKSARGRTNFCVRHGGGKRCRFEGCTKSAQGSTDFCKAHGGGKRCSWGQLGSEFNDQAAVPCDKFARGKSGLCASHAAQVLEKIVHGGDVIGPVILNMEPSTVDKVKETVDLSERVIAADDRDISIGLSSYGHEWMIYSQMARPNNMFIRGPYSDQISLPEGRVHGGSLMSILRGSTSFQTSSTGVGGEQEPAKLNPIPKWL